MSVTPYGIILCLYIIWIFYKTKNNKNRFLYLFSVSLFLYTNITIGYVIKVGNQTIAGYFFSTLICAFCAIILLKKVKKRVFYFVSIFLILLVISFVVIPLMNYTVVGENGWDYYLFGADNLTILKLNGSHVKEFIKAVAFVLILQVCYKEFGKKEWKRVIDSVLKGSKVVLAYGVIEFIAVYFFRVYNLYSLILQPIFGLKDSTYAVSVARGTGHQLQGLFTEPSAYATGLFFLILMFITQYQMNRTEGKGDRKKTYLGISICLFLMVLSMSFSAVLYLFVLFCWAIVYFYINSPQMRIWIISFAAIIFIVIVGSIVWLLNSDTYQGERLLAALTILKKVFVSSDLNRLWFQIGNSARDGSSISRIGSSIGILKMEFSQNPIIGLGVGTANSHALVPNMLTDLGLLGFAMWIKMVALNNRKKHSFGYNMMLFVVLLIGFLCVPFNYLGIDAIAFFFLLRVLFDKKWC